MKLHKVSPSYQRILIYELEIQVTPPNISEELKHQFAKCFPWNFKMQVSISSYWEVAMT